MREIVVRTTKETGLPIEALFELRMTAFSQWIETGLLDESVVNTPFEQFRRYLSNKAVFVAHDAATGELLAMHTFTLNKRKGIAIGANLAVIPEAKREGIASQMLQKEIGRFSKAGYRYLCGVTDIPATWSVNWHQKNGYYITGYHRSEDRNYASYSFRKPIALDVRHHPLDLLWTRPIAPVSARLSFIASYIITCLIKTRTGQFTPLGRLAKRIFLKFVSHPQAHG